MVIRYEINSASLEQIYAHLRECDANFAPALSSRVDLLEYSVKLFQRSTSFEAWHGAVLVGMINAYFNNINSQIGFITNVSVLKRYMGQGLAAILLEMCKEYAQDLGFGKIRLEVSPHNSMALRLYSRAGFTVKDHVDGNLRMEYQIVQHIT